MKVALVDYGIGNLGSVRRALEELGAQVVIATHPAMLAQADRFVLPGVGAFGQAIDRLAAAGWVDDIRREVLERGTPMLGICLGMQLLARSSEEDGRHQGLDLVPGRVRRLDSLGCGLRLPHVGWNEVQFRADAPLFRGIVPATDFYFVHSYALDADDPVDVVATTAYGVPISAAICRGHVFGTQFHPEKSSRAGRQVLRNFLEFRRC